MPRVAQLVSGRARVQVQNPKPHSVGPCTFMIIFPVQETTRVHQAAVLALSSQLLAAATGSMRKQEVWPGRETCLAYSAGFPAEQVKVLMDLLAEKGGQLLQAADKMPDSPLGSQSNGESSMEGGTEALSPCLGPYQFCPVSCRL